MTVQGKMVRMRGTLAHDFHVDLMVDGCALCLLEADSAEREAMLRSASENLTALRLRAHLLEEHGPQGGGVLVVVLKPSRLTLASASLFGAGLWALAAVAAVQAARGR